VWSHGALWVLDVEGERIPPMGGTTPIIAFPPKPTANAANQRFRIEKLRDECFGLVLQHRNARAVRVEVDVDGGAMVVRTVAAALASWKLE
jgi:hypothetical protein